MHWTGLPLTCPSRTKICRWVCCRPPLCRWEPPFAYRWVFHNRSCTRPSFCSTRTERSHHLPILEQTRKLRIGVRLDPQIGHLLRNLCRFETTLQVTAIHVQTLARQTTCDICTVVGRVTVSSELRIGGAEQVYAVRSRSVSVAAWIASAALFKSCTTRSYVRALASTPCPIVWYSSRSVRLALIAWTRYNVHGIPQYIQVPINRYLYVNIHVCVHTDNCR